MIQSDGKVLNFAPQALGETVPSLVNGYFYGKQGLDLVGHYAAYSALYKAQPSIATVVDKIANAAARLTVKVWDTTGDGGRSLDSESPFAKLIANPCTEMPAFNFWRWTFSTYEVYGEAFWYKQRDDSGAVVNLLPMHPSRVAVHRDSFGNVEYIFTLGVASAGILKAPSSDVVAFQRYNPESLMRGSSRLEPLRTTLLNEDAARRATQSWWTRGARPSVVLKHPASLSQQAQDRLKANFDARHAGADNQGGTVVLEEGMEAQVVQLTAEEMQYIESRKMNLQEVCMVFDVPPPVVHILDHATFSNITEQMRSMYRDTMAPRLEDVESVIDFALRPEFFKAGDRMVKFSLDEVLRGDFETRAQSVATLITSGVMKPSEARQLFDLDVAGPKADKLYANSALTELGATPPAPAPAPSEVPTGDENAAENSTEAPGAEKPSEGDEAKPLKKGMGLKYSPDQLRDGNGRFSVDGASGDFKPGNENWKTVDTAELVKADVAKQVADAQAAGVELTEKQIAALERKSETFHSKNYVVRNGSTMLYTAKPTPAERRAGYASELAEKFAGLKTQIDSLQEHAPLENVSVYLRPGAEREANTAAWALKTGEGTSIQLNSKTMVEGALGLAFAEAEARRTGEPRESTVMPSVDSKTVQEFTLAHEWGHAFNNATNGADNDLGDRAAKAVEIVKSNPDLQVGLSDYSKKGDGELYAELFAQHYFESVHGAPSMPATDAVKEYLK